jgi:tyrosine-protein phosphatase non-receptor type 11
MKESLRDKLDGSIIVLKYPLSPKEPTSERYFHGSITSKEANDLLVQKGKLGSYLVRESRTNPHDYVLSVLCDNMKVVHLIINCNERGYTTPNLDKYFPTMDEFMTNCIKMCPIVDVKDNVVYLKQPLNCSRVNAINFSSRCNELEIENRFNNNKNGLSEEFEVIRIKSFIIF